MNKRLLTITYIVFDLVASLLTWGLFFVYRKYNVDHQLFEHFSSSVLDDSVLYLGMLFCPVFWIILHSFSGYYRKVYRRSRLKEFLTTFLVTLLGTLLFFFAFILDDIVNAYSDYIRYYLFLFFFQFFLTYIPRLIITTKTVKKIHSGEIGFNTLIIGSDKVALETYNLVKQQSRASGNLIIGYVAIPDETDHALAEVLPCLGEIKDLDRIVRENEVEELIIAIQNGKREYIESILMMMGGEDIALKIIPQTEDYIMGAVKTSSVIYEPLISINPGYLPDWQRYTKRFLDVSLSLLAIIVLSPVYLAMAIGVKKSSKGPVFYKQERIGLKGKPFHIIKFRSMYIDSEKDGPMLSRDEDPRITPFGRFMRKTRLDETPQFINVLIGEMSLVGPRPERQFFIDQIVKKAPHYKLLLNVKPGITSWGQVKYGYAENVDQMIERLKWDILYIENMSLQMDFKILIYTILIVLRKDGK